MTQQDKRKRKSSKQAREDREALLLSKLQAEFLKAHGHALDTSKKALIEKNAKLITGWQLVAARSMLGWGQVELAEKARVSIETIHLMESHAGEVIIKSNADLFVAS
jgi:DNA-binding XRE family transcriptional regulator